MEEEGRGVGGRLQYPRAEAHAPQRAQPPVEAPDSPPGVWGWVGWESVGEVAKGVIPAWLQAAAL